MAVTATVTVACSATQTKTVGQGTASMSLPYTKQFAFTDGAGAGMANILWQDSRSLADGATENLDLAGVLTDAYGTVLTNARIKAIIIENTSADASLLVGAAASAPWVGMFGDATDVLKIPPGCVFVLAGNGATGMPVTATTADLLKLAHDGTGSSALVYKIAILGAAT